jgi:hypothetical protein
MISFDLFVQPNIPNYFPLPVDIDWHIYPEYSIDVDHFQTIELKMIFIKFEENISENKISFYYS